MKSVLEYENEVGDFLNEVGSIIQYENERIGIEYKGDLKSFIQDLVFQFEIFNGAKKQADLYLSSDFNVFDLIAPDENKLSDIIALMIDHEESHGQGAVFLKELITLIQDKISKQKKVDQFQLSISADSRSTVRREYQTYNNRRVDIVVEFTNGFTIIIENKPWTNDQDKQAEDYIKHHTKYEQKENYVFVYLHKTGQPPSLNSMSEAKRKELEDQGKFVILSCSNDLRDYILSCIEKCKSDRFRYFLTDFKNWIEESFKEAPNVG